jgi:hypothetical protein
VPVAVYLVKDRLDEFEELVWALLAMAAGSR